MAQGLGFAVPANTARWVVGELLAHGRVRRPVLGIAVMARPVGRDLARRLDLLSDVAVEVVSVERGGPAHRAGLVVEDLLVAINDRLVSEPDDLHRLLARAPAGQPISLTVVRGGRKFEVTVSARDTAE